MKADALQPPIVAFKEWAMVCRLLARGEQHLIFRKGGIAEGRDGFAFKHDAFILFPTAFHAQAQGLRPEFRPESALAAANPEHGVTFEAFSRVVARAILTDWDQVMALRHFHGWTDETLERRFQDGSRQGLHLAVVRTYRLSKVLSLPWEKGFSGCRSWLSVPVSGPLSGQAVIPDGEHRQVVDKILKSLPANMLQIL